MSFKLENLKLEINLSGDNDSQEILKNHDFAEEAGLSDDRTFCKCNNDNSDRDTCRCYNHEDDAYCNYNPCRCHIYDYDCTFND